MNVVAGYLSYSYAIEYVASHALVAPAQCSLK